ncbi:threonine/serine exporter family protein [Fictibacillus sp. KU28468]|uniref:threonine/serine exporter family protein n=1 Tax=Fictibacillus sp. KU28468 TaxID=2991053 RepID=UPI0006A78AF4|nr:threonine/serine exporter family protein [Fictibacillus sp. KU28468]UZJ79880.1 threonine/serine exporter family protein [Fictibacillus sp. KU28468]
MHMIEAIWTSFIASAGFGILFNVPKKAVIPGGICGMIGWLIFEGMSGNSQFDLVLATAMASFVVAAISHLYARIHRMPVIIFSVSGIIPLVPGGGAYDTMRQLVENDYNAAIQLGSQTFLISGAIAFGLVLAGTIIPIILRSQRKVK